MDMEYMDVYRRPYSANIMQNFNSQPQHSQLQHGQPQPQGHQYPFWNQHLMALYQQHQQRAAMLGQGGMHASKQTEPKPRLAKDEVELLEREFAKNPKPNSSTKRELAEQMGVEVPRINNWFQNRRAKEKQMRKTAEFEAQQASLGTGSESKSSEDPEDQGAISEFYGLSNHHQPLGLSTAPFGDRDNSNDDSDEVESERQQSAFCEQRDLGVATMLPAIQSTESPASSDSDGYIHIEYDSSNSSLHHLHVITDLAPSGILPVSFSPIQSQAEYQRPAPYVFGLSEPHLADSLPAQSYHPMSSHGDMMDESSALDSFPDRGYFSSPPLPQFPSQLLAESMARGSNNESLAHQEGFVKPEQLSPCSIPDSPPTLPDMRFKSPPPPADIASRRNMRRPAPLGIPSIRNGSHGLGPKTGIDAPRRSETASPMRRISSATGGLPGRIQKSFASTAGPRSPFTTERSKEALLQSLQSSHSPIMASLNGAMSPLTPEGLGGQGLRENTVTTSASDDEQAYTFGTMGAMGAFPMFKAEPNIKTPPDTPGLPGNLQDHHHFFANSVDHAWNFVPQDEPLPTPSLCSHGGSELEFSMAAQMPAYVASQPVTPSFPPSIGPTYGGFFGGNMANTEYTFPDSYQPESSARSSPGGPPRSKQFQFAQNVTPQDFNTDK
ncbi:hypothetical protein B0T25DRAFT_586915 [Lasiosphaeria hispida]|uniref:Homeobox domain-containing protein n=1 Tax=Lasiosphaeria hispida TaxID=260671 RepID=A0AAJ0HTS9_9PEZI|nr:hypothetical protein B0T25DRAFT_586915 [Lasiosphaeria hispida]